MDDSTNIVDQPDISFEDVLVKIGAFGKSQIRIYLLASIVDVPIGLLILFFLFGGANPGWYCLSDSDVSQLNATYNMSVWHIRDALPNGTMTAGWAEKVCSINSTLCAEIVFKPGYTSIVTEFSLICDLRYGSTFCTTMLMVGILVGANVGGQLGDLYGRWPVYVAFLVVLVLAQFAQPFSPLWQVFAAVRFVGGCAAGALMVIGRVIPMEVIGKQWRTVVGCIGFWQIGNIAFAGLAYLIPNWRHLSLATAVLSAPVLLTCLFIPESPRWLVQKNRIPEATKILRKMASQNGRPLPEEHDLYCISKRDKTAVKYAIPDLFRDLTTSKKTILMFFLWFVCALTYYGMYMNAKDLSGSVYMNVLIMAVIELVVAVTVIYTAYRFGRRPSLLVYLLVAACSLFTLVGLTVTNTAPLAQSIIGGLGRAATNAAWSIVGLLTAELFPTVIRSVAVGTCSTVGRVGGIIAPQIAFLVVVHPSFPGIIYGILAISGAILAFTLLPETKGVQLPDVLPPKRGCCKSISSTDPQPDEVQEEEQCTMI